MKRLLIPTSLFGVLFGFFAVPGKAQANVQDFTVTNFEADYYLSQEDPQGSLEIQEKISVDFRGNNHGIVRAIPMKYDGQSTGLEVLSVKYRGSLSGETYTTYKENDNLVLKIGDPNRTVTGQQEYEIYYRMHNVIKFYESHDELYWDINGDQWQQPFSNITARVHLPEGLDSSGQLSCFTGQYGATGSDCQISEENGRITALTTRRLGGREALTVVVGFEKGFFAPATLSERLRDYQEVIAFNTLLPVLAGGYAIVRWRRNGREPAGRGVVVPEYSSPDKLLPAELGAVMDSRVHRRAITATIIDLAIRGYIKIIEDGPVKGSKGKMAYSFELTKTDFSKLSSYEASILRGMFPGAKNKKAGSAVSVSQLKQNFYKTVVKVQPAILKKLLKDGYFKRDPMSTDWSLWLVLGAAMALTAALISTIGPLILIGFVLTAVIILFALFKMSARTLKGVEARDHGLGLKLYLETAEAERIKMMQSPGARYNQYKEPKKTVHLYEKFLPYAIIFGVEKQWSEQFKDIYEDEPDWYKGRSATLFRAIHLSSALNGDLGAALSAAYTSPTSASGSGFSGGFSGGGGGGGGGGGW